MIMSIRSTQRMCSVVVVVANPSSHVSREETQMYADNLSLHVSSRGITLTWSVHRSIGPASTLYRYDVKKGDLFLLSCARVLLLVQLLLCLLLELQCVVIC